MVVNCDLKVAKDLFSLDAFSGRGSFPLFNLYENENYGIVNSNGNLWEVHRRFTLRQLRDFGFGKNTMEALIMDEVHEFKEMLKKKGGKPIGEIKDKFSLAVVNSLWTVVGGNIFFVTSNFFINKSKGRREKMLLYSLIWSSKNRKHLPTKTLLWGISINLNLDLFIFKMFNKGFYL